MKTKKNFLKKLAALTLGFVMTLGVGAAGYAASASETRAADTTITFEQSDAGLFYESSTTSTTEHTFTKSNVSFGIKGAKTKSSSTATSGYGYIMLMGGNIYNTSAPANTYVKSVVITYTSGTGTSGKIITSFGTSALSSRVTSGGTAPTKGGTVTATNNDTTKAYFNISNTTTSNTQISSVAVTWSPTGSTPTTGYTVSFNNGGGTGSMTALTNQTSIQSAPSCTFTAPTNKEFSHWSTTSGGSAASFPMNLTQDVTLYAVWKDTGGGGGGQTTIPDGTYSLTITVDSLDLAGSYPSSLPASKTIKAVELTTKQEVDIELKYGSIMKNTNIQFKKSGDGYIYNVTDLGTVNSVTIDETSSNKLSYYIGSSLNPTSSGSGGFFKVYTNSGNAGYANSIVINFTVGTPHTVGTISVDKDVYIGKTATCSAECDQDDGITWSVENGTGSATINASTGVITGVTAGTVTVTATCAGGGSNTKTVTVKADSLTLKSISASGATDTFTLGNSFVTTGLVVTGTYSHANGDPDSQQIISTGITTSPSAGTKLTTQGQQSVTVNAGGKSTTYSITVNYAAVTGIAPAVEEQDMGPGDELVFTASVSPENANPNYTVSASSDDLVEGEDYIFDDDGDVLILDDTKEGTLILTFTSTGKDSGGNSKTCTTTINVSAQHIPQVVEFTASGTPTKAKQYRNATFSLDLSGITITGTFDDESTQTFNSDQFSWNTTGEHPVGTYLLNDELDVTVYSITLEDDGLGSIAFVDGCDMTNKEYWVGDNWNFAGLAIEGKYKSGGDFTLDTSKVSFTTTSTTSAAGDSMSIVVTAHYQGFSGTEPTKTITGIKVKAVTMTSLTVSYTGGQPVLGTDFVFAGTITANYSNGDTQPITDFSTVTIGNVNKFILDEQTITVTHKTTGASGTFKVQYKTKTIRYQTVWTKVSSIAAGDVVTFVYEGTDAASYGYEFAKADGTLSSNYLVVTMNGSITTSSGVTTLNLATDSETSQIINPYEFTVVDTSSTLSGTVAFKNAAGNYMYASNAKSSSNYLAMSEGAPSSSNQKCWNVSFSGSVPTIKTQTSTEGTWRYIKYNKGSGQERFSGYVSGQEAIAVYKKTQTPIDEPSIIKLNASIVKDSQGVEKTFNEGDPITVDDFTCSTLNDLNETSPVTATSVEPTTLNSGVNEVTVHYGTWSTKVSVNAAEVAHLDSIEVVENTGKRVFERGDTFTSDGLEVMAHYSNTDKTKFPDHKVTDFEITTTPDMTVLGNQNIGVSYTENGVTKTTSYTITINPKTSTWITISGEGITGSDGQYYLTSEVTNNVALTFEKDGEEETVNSSTTSSFLSFANGVLSINSSTTTSEQGDITFSAGNASAKLTVTVTAQESITLISDEEVSGFIGDEFDVEIALGNVGSAEWTLPSSADGFTVTTTSKDNTGFVGTISVSEACANKEAVFSVLTGKGETLSVSVYITAIYDAIDSISATCSKTYIAGRDSFNKSDLIVTYERLSGATGTLTADEFTVSGAPTGKLARTSYNLTITSVEGSKTCNCTISASMPTGLNVVTAHTEEVPGQTTVTWSKLTNKTQVDANEKVYIYNSDKGYVTGYNGSDATVSSTSSDRVEFTISIVDATQGTFKLCDPNTQKYITYYSSNKFGITSSATDSNVAIFKINSDGHFECVSKDSTTSRYLCANGNYLRMYTGIGSYTPFDLYISKTTTGEPTTKTTYTNHESMSGTMFDFINRWGGTELTAGNWDPIFGSDEYKALTATDKEWFKTGVVADEGTMESCEMFADFITKYDELVAINGLDNYLERTPLSTYTITINYDNGDPSGTAKVIRGEKYTLPEEPTKTGYVFTGWTVGDSTELLDKGTQINVSENITIKANWTIGISLTNSVEFKFTGLDMLRFQYVFNGTHADDAQKYGFLVSTSGNAKALENLTNEQISNGEHNGILEVNKDKLVIGTEDGSKTVSVMFYYVDKNGNVQKSEVITMSFDSFVTADGFDPSIYEDPYAIMCLQYYIASLGE